MSVLIGSTGEVGPRRVVGPLDRAVIIDTAQQCVDAQGLRALTMRHLGSLLGVEAMAIYRHFTGRGDLLAQMRAQLLNRARDEIEWRADRWQDIVLSVASEMRVVWNEHPAMIPVLSIYNVRQPWLRPPVALVALVEDLLAALQWTGLSDEQSVVVYRSLSGHLLGAMFAAQSSVEFAADLDTVLNGLDVPLAELPGAR